MIQLNSLGLRYHDKELLILDQTQLPQSEVWRRISGPEDMIDAIKKLQVRGAPLIGVAAALSLAVAAQQSTERNFADLLLTQAKALNEARPTAVNLMNCMRTMRAAIKNAKTSADVVQAAVEIFHEDVKLAERMSIHGRDLINDGDNLLTHCNTGGLATVGIGTALGVIIGAHQQKKKIHVYVDETRPLLQGGRLTAWELQKHGIPYTLITDNMAGHVMSLGRVQKIFVGADRIAVNGDFANKIGTYSVAVLAKFHQIPFYVVAPYTTVDPHCTEGSQIPIEQRDPAEVRGARGAFGSAQWAPVDAPVYNPSFDVTPATLTSGWVLDKKLYSPADVLRGELHKAGVN